METADTPTLILHNLPPSALAGIDLLSFTTTPRFQGVKNLPPGFHFTYVGSSTAFSERHGVWFEIPKNTSSTSTPLIITKWEGESETLVVETDSTAILRWRANLGSLWQKSLTPYRQSTTSAASADDTEELVDWDKLTSHITQPLLSRICAGEAHNWTLTSASSAKRDIESIPGLTAQETSLQVGEELHFLPVDLRQTWRQGATGRERTDAAQDRSWALRNVIEAHCGNGCGEEVVGELQFCFLMILTLNNFSCLEQWKRLLTLLFTCSSAVETHSALFVLALGTLRLQLQHCKVADNGLIELADEGGSLLRSLLVRFRRGVERSQGLDIQDVMDELDDLEAYLHEEHGWQFGGSFAKSGVLELEDGETVRMDTTAFDEEDETGEYAPQIVDLTPEQARLLNVGGAEELHHGLKKTSLRDIESEDEGGESERGDDEEHRDDEEEYEEQDLDEMDSRY
ncbi:Hypothetical protein R9X50_00162200 [Acrodontium crateriforme]|uniref:AAR2 n=1 Tax=Acrodontium crateriforme TaxID=150365 RepID=A0AAQ3LZM3_9PEZI|nr:Hypothetical protein R9X50_00162200 [Acrodontium crateriforme]